MRLLRIEENGDFSLVEYVGDDVPQYAILSHRWEIDQEEVTLKDLIENLPSAKQKKGYRKIQSCAKQAARDGWQFFWVDTCCIDKTSSSELSEAINSMWRWYRDSQVCYAYLNDVPANINPVDGETAFAVSRWFTRGWTLQELLAPSVVVLFDTDWVPIGTKMELAERINDITGIDLFYLGTDTSKLDRASVAEKMSWASARETKRPEDIAYCLLGIFGINMPLLYGEGERAFLRLQEEIIKQSDDHSILAWIGIPWQNSGLLAHSPADFRGCGNIVRSINSGPIRPYAITNRGLQIKLPLIKRRFGTSAIFKTYAGLNCRFSDDFFSDLAIPICQEENNFHYQRDTGKIRAFPITEWRRAKAQSIYMRTSTKNYTSRSEPIDDSILLRKLPRGYVISQVLPLGLWSPGIRAINRKFQNISHGSPHHRILVLISSGTCRFAVLLYQQQSLFVRDWVLQARLVPTSIEPETDISELYEEWRFRDLPVLPRVHKFEFGVVYLQAAPLLVRGKGLMVIDVMIKKPPNQVATLEVMACLIEVYRYNSYRLLRIRSWLSEPLHKQYAYIWLFYFAIIAITIAIRRWMPYIVWDNPRIAFVYSNVATFLISVVWLFFGVMGLSTSTSKQRTEMSLIDYLLDWTLGMVPGIVAFFVGVFSLSDLVMFSIFRNPYTVFDIFVVGVL
jgi:hypothetical protein